MEVNENTVFTQNKLRRNFIVRRSLFYIELVFCLAYNNKRKKQKLYGPFLWMGFNYLKATATSKRQFTFYHSVPRNSWYSFYRPRKDERLSRPWTHLMILNTELLDWESSTLTTGQNSPYV